MTTPGGYIAMDYFQNAPNPTYNKLAETMIIPDNYPDLKYKLKHDMLGNGTHAVLSSWVGDDDLAMGIYFN